MRLGMMAVLVMALTAPAVADWPGHVIKWDQLAPWDDFGAGSWIDTDTPSDALSADDFLCTETSWITDIRFAGFSYYGPQYLTHFRVTFWSDVPATPNDASHPGTLLYDATISPADPMDPLKLGWQDVGDGTFKINLPRELWFFQEGTPTFPRIYWLGIQGIMLQDGAFDAFYWNFRSRTVPNWGDDAAFMSNYFGYPPWANWGIPPTGGNPVLYDGPLAPGWSSLDLAFQLTGIPEPTTLLFLAVGLPLIVRRWR
ncbi:MAG: hypothetical protein L6Q92_08275 [Phycisphaerae bacterium]|nr:hypothetical protein [Phycisphaerae bacterium]